MTNRLRQRLLKFLRIRERPEPPEGSSDSVSMFRASPKYFGYSALNWGVKQAGALFGLLIPLGVVDRVFNMRLSGINRLPDRFLATRLSLLGFDTGIEIGNLANWVEVLAVFGFLVQLVVSGLLLRLAWEMRWYVVTDKAIRIREGLFRTREQTLTIAKIQNLRTHQGPLQRLFGIADLEVQTAGGGGGSRPGGKKKDPHTARMGRFRGIEDVEPLKNRIRRLQAGNQDAGLGDLNRAGSSGNLKTKRSASLQDPAISAALVAMVAEARRLREAIEDSWRTLSS